jgi:putative transposase
MVDKMEDWKFSSFIDFAGLRNGTLCNKDLAFQLLDLDAKRFYEDSYKIAEDETLNNIF